MHSPPRWAQDEDLVYFVQVGFLVRQILRCTRGPAGAVQRGSGGQNGNGFNAGSLTPTAVCLLSLVQGGHDVTRLHETMLMLCKFTVNKWRMVCGNENADL